METLRIYSAKIPSNIKNVHDIVSDIMCCMQNSYGMLEECIIFELKVILNELILNAIKHGNKEDSAKYVNITAGLTRDESAYILIEDEGEGCNCKYMVDSNYTTGQDVDLYDMKETGRGLHIVGCLCERIKFNSRGNKVVVLKKLCKK